MPEGPVPGWVVIPAIAVLAGLSQAFDGIYVLCGLLLLASFALPLLGAPPYLSFAPSAAALMPVFLWLASPFVVLALGFWCATLLAAGTGYGLALLRAR